MPYKDPEDRKKYNREYGSKYYKNNREKIKARVYSLRNKRQDSGMCRDCRKKRRYYESSRCLRCRIRDVLGKYIGTQNAVEAFKQLLKNQRGICFYTGVSLRKKEIEIDHKLPRSRYPELERDVNNMVLCIKEVNRAKGAMTDEEFYKLCELVTRTKGKK